MLHCLAGRAAYSSAKAALACPPIHHEHLAMAAVAVATSGCRLVRNQGPFPFIQSEGGFLEPSPERTKIRNTPHFEIPNFPGRAPEESDAKPSPCSDVMLSDYQLEAIIRLRQQLDLQRTPTTPLGTRSKQLKEAQRQSLQPPPQPQDIPPAALKPDRFVSPMWSAKLTPWDRLSTHHTLNSVRNHALMYRPFVIQSDLEFVLNSVYDHSRTMWAGCAGVVVQPETVGLPTWKVFRNTRVKQPEEVILKSPYQPKSPPPGAPGGPIGAPLYGEPRSSHGAQRGVFRTSTSTAIPSVPRSPIPSLQMSVQSLPSAPRKGDRDHPLRYGGLTEKLSPHSVKLAISGNHVSQTNAGYSRKVDGTFFS